MRIDYFGPNYNFFEDAFFGLGGLDAVLQGTPTSTQAVYLQPDTGMVTTIAGSGFTLDALGNVTGGTITGMSFVQTGTTVAEFSDMSWSAVGLFSALVAADSGNQAPLEALFNSAPLTLDASAATVPLIDTQDLFDFTVDTTIIGSDFADTLAGGTGNDTIWFGNVGNDYARDTAGNDTYVFTDAVDAYSRIVYNQSIGGINATIDGDANFGRIVKANGVDTLIDIVNPLKAGWTTGGFQLGGTDKDDVFTIDGGAETWMEVRGQEGNDVFNLTLSGTIRLNFDWNGYNAATQGLNINVATGMISNDGFGFADTLNITAGEGHLQIRGTGFADTIVGSAAGESFFLYQGSDSVDGGGGRDTLRYDRSGVDAVTVDLAAGIATGVWYSDSFTHRFTSIEQVRGSRDGNDILKGDGKGNWIQGRGGDDDISGRGGKDSLDGGDGNDTLNGGNGNDKLWDGAGDDLVKGGAGNDIFYNGGDADTFDGGKGRDTLVDDTTYWTDTPATLEMNMAKGIHGYLGTSNKRDQISSIENYTLIGDWDSKVTGNGARNVVKTDRGEDWVNGNNGNDKITTGAGNDVLLGGKGKDYLSAGTGRDVIKGGAGADVLIAGKGTDRMVGGAGADAFVFAGSKAEGKNTITDFEDGVDQLRILDGDRFTDVTLSGTATRTVVELSGGTTIVLKGVDVALIGADDFDFA